ncbi:MAG: non-canonical purine NTP pyrophosphatase, RdgB/HAM1 family [Flammeovirgaceae bacterium]|nr:non-canonical purine NTP pyrophosphatase, RdgB/HAM1 family [Flammeovirgaceae bacterium]
MRNICFVTGNQNKIIEVEKLIKNFKLISTKDLNFYDEILETENTIKGNAFLKSSFIYNKFNINCFSDDSGLFINALGGDPGVRSARYASEISDKEKNINLVLKNLKGEKDRSAAFKTCICLIIDGKTNYFEGSVKGVITSKRLGSRGFGYDPIFVPEGHDRSFAEMSLEDKNKISHRSIATKKLINFLNQK